MNTSEQEEMLEIHTRRENLKLPYVNNPDNAAIIEERVSYENKTLKETYFTNKNDTDNKAEEVIYTDDSKLR